jgi:hypothetical protein
VRGPLKSSDYAPDLEYQRFRAPFYGAYQAWPVGLLGGLAFHPDVPTTAQNPCSEPNHRTGQRE